MTEEQTLQTQESMARSWDETDRTFEQEVQEFMGLIQDAAEMEEFDYRED